MHAILKPLKGKLLISISICMLLLLSLIYDFSYSQEFPDNKTYKIYKFNIKEMIAPPVWHKTKKAFKEAGEMKADIILIHMNTYGGMLGSADSMRTIILQSRIPVFVFIDNNAASAGALIAIASNKIFMRKGANIGAATVVNEKGEKMPDKYQSYMRSMMRSTAEARNRDPEIAEAMVGAIKKVDNISDSGRVLTFTTSEAIKYKYCDGEAESIQDVMKLAGVDNYSITQQRLTFIDKIIGFLINPIVSGILIMVIVAGIYFEFQSPGAVFPIILAAAAAILYFAPHYLEGIANNWEIVLFICGVVLIAVEIFVFPGHGVWLIAGIVMVVTGLTIVMINNLGFMFNMLPGKAILLSVFIVIIAMFSSLIGSFLLSRKLFSGTLFGKSLSLETVQEKEKGYSIADSRMNSLIGNYGTALTILRPVGKVDVMNDIYPATAIAGYIEKGEKIKVVGYENAQLIVEKVIP